jgi:glutamine amidotransferase
MGNIRNVQRGLQSAGAEATVTTQPSDLTNADAIVLPGVGAFRDAINNLAPFKGFLLNQITQGTPVFGICLGLQLLFTQSTEDGLHKGLDVFQGQILRLPENQKFPPLFPEKPYSPPNSTQKNQGMLDNRYSRIL